MATHFNCFYFLRNRALSASLAWWVSLNTTIPMSIGYCCYGEGAREGCNSEQWRISKRFVAAVGNEMTPQFLNSHKIDPKSKSEFISTTVIFNVMQLLGAPLREFEVKMFRTFFHVHKLVLSSFCQRSR